MILSYCTFPLLAAHPHQRKLTTAELRLLSRQLPDINDVDTSVSLVDGVDAYFQAVPRPIRMQIAPRRNRQRGIGKKTPYLVTDIILQIEEIELSVVSVLLRRIAVGEHPFIVV